MEIFDSEYSKNKTFDLKWINLGERTNIRDLKSVNVGNLVCFTGTITKTSEVRPELIKGTFTCDICSNKVINVEQQFRFTEPTRCSNRVCNNTSKFTLNEELSYFEDWQKLRVQEPTKEMSSGNLPRSLDVIVRGEQVDKVQPGDDAIIYGMLLSVPYGYSRVNPGEKFSLNTHNEGVKRSGQISMEGITGVRKFGSQDLNYRFIFLANNFEILNNWVSNEGEENGHNFNLKKHDDKIFYNMKNDPNIFNNLASCIAPNIWGSTEIKKGILLMLFGGNTKFTNDGMKLRGDINMCIVGDPSTAKSQFLKFVHTSVPRSVYANGKGTTAAGLTAAVTKDVETNEFGIEAGALIMADNGICCIDEFDKIDEQDTSAIHEAMEQQTISITKAGIQATLNSRTTILAALNPRYGRYDKSKSLRMNINMAPPLMSRFDLIFVLTDDCDENRDLSIAQQILNCHKTYTDNYIKFGEGGIDHEFLDVNKGDTVYTFENLLRYMKMAKGISPRLTEESGKEILNCYLDLRNYCSINSNSSLNITVRQLESLIRLSEAIAKIHYSQEIEITHVSEAAKLLRNSILQIKTNDINIVEETPLSKENHYLPERIKEENKSRKIEVENDNENENKAKKKKIKMSNDEYQAISRDIIEIIKMSNSPLRKTSIFSKLYLGNADIITDIKLYKMKVNASFNQMLLKDKRLIRLSSKEDKDPLIGLHDNIM